ncbi:hypothetical protein BO71DRAFT_435287 [Aspergillus ellipticus CBS 707.79]|uniref:Uncharacterized protein n=1 Tax=Aspergillus ellipticus CBS 707.79 TaxID=1448320 RepID=A0A319D353_9EURO|nr:hypothetical protein BO71DRAFT_435287 [Aspergillus ellipticus CBS 707.79]
METVIELLPGVQSPSGNANRRFLTAGETISALVKNENDMVVRVDYHCAQQVAPKPGQCDDWDEINLYTMALATLHAMGDPHFSQVQAKGDLVIRVFKTLDHVSGI